MIFTHVGARRTNGSKRANGSWLGLVNVQVCLVNVVFECVGSTWALLGVVYLFHLVLIIHINCLRRKKWEEGRKKCKKGRNKKIEKDNEVLSRNIFSQRE